MRYLMRDWAFAIVRQLVSGHCQDDNETLFEANEEPQQEVRGGDGEDGGRQRWA